MTTRTKTNAPKDGTKQATALKLLKKGATIEQLSKAVKQQPVTVRTLIQCLRTRGYNVVSKGEGRYAL